MSFSRVKAKSFRICNNLGKGIKNTQKTNKQNNEATEPEVVKSK